MKWRVSCVTYDPKLRPTIQCHVGLYFLSNSFLMYAAMSWVKEENNRLINLWKFSTPNRSNNNLSHTQWPHRIFSIITRPLYLNFSILIYIYWAMLLKIVQGLIGRLKFIHSRTEKITIKETFIFFLIIQSVPSL